MAEAQDFRRGSQSRCTTELPIIVVRVTDSRFYDAASGLLTREAFRFMVDHQLRHAQRAQEFLTLVVFSAERDWRELAVAADEWIVKELARLIGCAVRSTDLLARTADDVLSLLLVGADAERSRQVIKRIGLHLRRYTTAPAVEISVGAACCPTHACCAEELLRHALALRAKPEVESET